MEETPATDAGSTVESGAVTEPESIVDDKGWLFEAEVSWDWGKDPTAAETDAASPVAGSVLESAGCDAEG